MKWILAAPLAFALSSCSGSTQNADVQFAQTSFTSLARGDSSAESLIDFETLRVAGADVAAQYAAMPNDKEKSDFRRSFIAGFASSFQSSGASADSLTNWRVQSSDSARTIVAADGPKSGLTVAISRRDDLQKISAIELAPKAP